MNRWMLLGLVLSCLFVGFACGDEGQIQIMLARHNAFRAEVGLPPQALDAGLCSYAQNLADRQAAAGRMFHSGSEWPWPECVCYGAGGGDHAVAMWIGSGPHNAILRSRTQAVGFGFRNGFAAALFGGPVGQTTVVQQSNVVCEDGSCTRQTTTTTATSTSGRVRWAPLIRRGRFSGCRFGRCG